MSDRKPFRIVLEGEWLAVDCPMYGVHCCEKDIPTLHRNIVDQLYTNIEALVFTQDPLSPHAIEVGANLKVLLRECLAEFVSHRCEK